MPARGLHDGSATGPLLRLAEPLSFWGGTDVGTSEIVDPHHPQCGQRVAGHVLVLPRSRGSSSSSSVLAEQIRTGVGPAAIVLAEPDAILVLGALVAAALYDIHVPVVTLDAERLDALPQHAHAKVEAIGDEATLEIVPDRTASDFSEDRSGRGL